MPESEAPPLRYLKPAECECAAWAACEQAAASYILVAPDGDVLTHHPACQHAVTETLSDADFEVLSDFEILPDPQSELLALELARAREWASRWKALAKALHAELTATHAETLGHDYMELHEAEPMEKVGRTSGLRLRSLGPNERGSNRAAAGADRKR